MKRRQFLQAAGLAAAATAVAKPAIAQSMPELKWRLTSSFPKSLDTIYGAADVFAKAVAEATDKQVPDSSIRRRRDRTGACCCRRGAKRHGRDVRYGVLLLFWQGPDLRIRHGGAVRPQCPHAKRLAVFRRRHGADERILQEVQHHRVPGRQYRAQMGGWFRKEIKDVNDLKGLKIRIGGFAGTVLAKLASCRSRSQAATSMRRWRRHDRRRRMGRAL